MYELYIQHKKNIYNPVVVGSVTWTTERAGSPGTLDFSVKNDEKLNYQEGSQVILRKDDTNVFFGFIFSKGRNKEQIIKNKSYDQLRYLKNKDSFSYTNKTASEVLGLVAAKNNLQVGSLENTGYKIAERVEDNKTYFDIIQMALDLTLINKKKLYVMYDDFGKIALRDVEKMKISDLVVGEYNGEDFDYETEIDSDTYNRIKLYKDNEKTKKREVYIAQSGESINDWGLLQYYESVGEETNPQAKAQALLTLKNRKKRKLRIKDIKGDLRCRAGASVMVLMRDIGDISIKQYMLIEKATHTFTHDTHFMDLELRGDV